MRMKRVAIKCHANLNTGEGKVIIEDFFHDLDSLLKADLLKDFSEIMDSLYEESLKEWRRDMAELALSGDHLKEFVKDAEEMVKDAVDDQADIERIRERL